MIGETLSHYEIVEKIGAGGMGEVYRARDPRLGREVAIKVLPSSLSQNVDRLARFEKEARTTGTLNHPNVLAIYDVGSDGGVPFLVTELLTGETLRERIDGGSLTRRKALEFAAQIADGLAAAHGKNIIHRDLKPDNVFITRDGHVKILDFGLAKLTEPDPTDSISTESPTEGLTAAGMVVGTPGYMSPEQLHGGSVDLRSDIFSFGIMLYEMISGQRPFVGATTAEVAASIMRDDPVPLSGEHRDVSPTLDRLVRQCLEKSPDDRFESAHDLAHTLRAVSDSGEISVTAPVQPYKRPVLWPALTAIVVVIIAAGGWWLLDLRPSPEIPEVKHIAVLPFEAVGDDLENRYLAAGLAATVADGLTIMERETRGAAWVLPPDPGVTLAEARNEHNATIGVRGVLDRGVDRVRLDLEVLDARSGSTLVRRTLDENARNLAGLQKEPVLTVWQMLGFEATPAALESLDELSTNTMIACRAYLSGRGRLQMATDEQDLLAAAASLEQAIGEDPNHVPSRVALARTFGRLLQATGDQQWLERAVNQAERAGALDDDAAEPYMALGEVYSAAGQTEASLDAYRRAAARAGIAAPYIELGSAATDAGEFDTAERALQTAINLRPDFADSHLTLGYLYFNTNQLDATANQFRHATRAAPENVGARVNLGAVLALQGRTGEAIRAFEDALVIEPTARAYSNLGTLYFEDGRFGDAAEMFEKGIELEGDDIPADQYYLLANLASALYWSGERGGARTSYLRAIELAESFLEDGSSGNQTVLADLAGYYGMVGQPERGLELLEAFSLQEIHDPYMMGAVAESFEDLSERDRAVEWLGTALANGLPVDWVESRPSFNSLREDERYRELAKNLSDRG